MLLTTFKTISFLIIITSICIGGSFAQENKFNISKANRDTIYITSTDYLKSNKIPDSVFQMTHLKTLWISGKDCDVGGPHNDNNPNDGIRCWMINEIPRSIGNLVNLDTLGLTLGVFGKFPKEISKLKHLRYLDLTDSYMSDIDDIVYLDKLDHLLLFGCGLSKLPTNISLLTNLKFIGLVGNNLDNSEIDRIKKVLPKCEVYYH